MLNYVFMYAENPQPLEQKSPKNVEKMRDKMKVWRRHISLSPYRQCIGADTDLAQQ